MVLVDRTELILEETLPKHFSNLDGVKVSTCETMIVAWSSSSSDVCIWQRQVNVWSKIILPHPCKVNDVDIKEDAIALGQRDGGVAIWKMDKHKFIHHKLLWGHSGQSVTLIKFHRNGDLLATGSTSDVNTGLVNIWSLSIGTVIQTVAFDAQEGPPVSMTWLGHRRLTIANKNSAEVTVVLMPTNYDQEFNLSLIHI